MYRQTFNIPPDNLPAADAPVCSSQQKEVFGAARGELVAVECALEANPDTDLAFEWTFTKGDERLDMQQSQIRCVSAWQPTRNIVSGRGDPRGKGGNI